MSDWSAFALALLAFYGSHMIPARPAIRARLTAALGRPLYLLAYGAISILLLGWLVAAAAQAPHLPLWERAAWQNLVPQILMLPACLLAAFGMGAAGGLSLGGRDSVPLDCARPGSAAITRHPLLWALLLWALAHLAPNGDLAHVILFGSFALTAALGMAAFDRRTRRRLGEGHWQEVVRATAFLPLARGARAPGLDRPWLRVAVALGVYAALLLLHEPVIGLSPL
jgi:uncharacterized membrane protein